MDNTSPAGDRMRTNWTPSMDRYFIDLVIDQVHKGNMSDHSFRKQIWSHMITLFNVKFGFQYDKDVLRNRYKTLRRQYNDIKALLDQSGFRWDDARQMVTADDNIWDDYIKAHPDVRSYRTKILPYYNDMCVIYGNAESEGRNNSLGQDVDLDSDSPEMKIGGGLEGPKSPTMTVEDLLNNVQGDPSHVFEDMMKKSTDGNTVDDFSEREARALFFDNENKENGGVIPINVVQEDLQFPGMDIMRRRTDEGMVNDAREVPTHLGEVKRESNEESMVPDMASSPFLRKENNISIPIENKEKEPLPLGEHTVKGSNEGGEKDARPDKATAKENEASSLEDSSHIGKDTVRESHKKGAENASPDMGILVSSGENEMKGSEISIPAESVSVICALEAVQYGTNSSNRSRVTWTPTMDRYFIDLMLGQVNKGNKLGRSFNKQSWMDMAELFGAKFGVLYEKDVLKNRYKNLRKQYAGITNLLAQDGFSWDKTLQMVTADVRVWDNYIKEHPDARQYRIKPVPYYDDLCVIYENGANFDGKGSCSGHDLSLDNDVKATKIGVRRNPHPPAVEASLEDIVNDLPEISSHMGRENDNISGQKRKNEPVTPLTSQHSKRLRDSTENSMADALHEMAVAVNSLVEKKENTNKYSIEHVIAAVQAIPDIDEDLLLDACDLFEEDERKAKTFMALDASIRKKWLMRKLRT